jgi:hypothetical protein
VDRSVRKRPSDSAWRPALPISRSEPRSRDYCLQIPIFCKIVGGVINGNLMAPSSTDINNQVLDNGVYNYGGEFPIDSQYSANFWTDVVFSPATSSSAVPAVSSPADQPVRSAAIIDFAPSHSSRLVISPPAATPAGPTIHRARLSPGTAPTFLGPLPSPGPIPQLGALGSLFKKSSWWAE